MSMSARRLCYLLCIPLLALMFVRCQQGDSPTVTVTPLGAPFDSSPIPMSTEGAEHPGTSSPENEALSSSPIPMPPERPIRDAASRTGEDWKAFAIHEPLVAGDMQVSGEGPAGLEVVIVDVTDMARELGRGQISPDGRFKIDIQSPLVGSHGVGVMILSSLSREAVLRLEDLRGPRSISLPRIGDVYVLAKVHDTEP